MYSLKLVEIICYQNKKKPLKPILTVKSAVRLKLSHQFIKLSS